jgi:Holliday junction resolvase RusA-like endonuclease
VREGVFRVSAAGDDDRATTRESSMTVSFVVIGTPAPQGSKTKWGSEDNPRTRPWRAAVAAAAYDARVDYTASEIVDPVTVTARFYFPRPKAHYRTGRYAGELKPSAPVYCSTTPDLDKLERAVGDALKGVLLRDDSQIVHWDTWKLYGAPARAEITITAA